MHQGKVVEGLARLDGPKAARAICTCLTNNFARDQVIKSLTDMGPAAEPELLPYLEKQDTAYYGPALTVLKAVGTEKSLSTLEKLTKHGNPEVAGEAQAAVQAIQARLRPGGNPDPKTPIDPKQQDPKKIEPKTPLPPSPIDPLLADLLSRDVFKIGPAADKLAKMPPDGRRQEVLAALAPLMADINPSVRDPAVRAYVAWATSADVGALYDALSKNRGGPLAIEGVAKLDGAKAAKVVAGFLANFSVRGDAVKALSGMGPAAEPVVLPYLQHRDAKVKVAALEVLKTIGTQQSLPLIAPLTQDRGIGVAAAARAAGQAIQARLAKQ